MSSSRAPGKTNDAPSPVDLIPPGLREPPGAPSDVEIPQSSARATTDMSTQVDPDVRQSMIREAAYQRYAQRGYVEGFDVEDWLAAEAEVDRNLAQQSQPAQRRKLR